MFFNDPAFQLYNIMFTALPVIVLGVFDQGLPRHTLQNMPAAFRRQKGTEFNGWVFFTVRSATRRFFFCFRFVLLLLKYVVQRM
jgi:magnesium-transporting ATPase (P-type)